MTENGWLADFRDPPFFKVGLRNGFRLELGIARNNIELRYEGFSKPRSANFNSANGIAHSAIRPDFYFAYLISICVKFTPQFHWVFGGRMVP